MVEVRTAVIAATGACCVAIRKGILNRGPVELLVPAVLREEELRRRPVAVAALTPNYNDSLPVA